jgi:N-acylneuraminate cytidylyltransferase
MKSENTFVAMIPLRGGSKSIPNKNIRPIAGKPLCAWVLEAAVNATRINSVYVSTDSPKIKEIVQSLELGIIVIDRPNEFATDDASTESVMAHFMQEISFDCLVTIQATSPMLKAKHIDEAVEKFEKEGYDSLLSAVRSKRFYWNDDGTPINYDPAHRPRRQEFHGTFMENGAFYITKSKIIKRYNTRLSGDIGIYEMPENTAIEIDEQNDWRAVSNLLVRG